MISASVCLSSQPDTAVQPAKEFCSYTTCWDTILDKADRVSDGLAVLEDFGWVRGRELRAGAGSKGGRPSMEWDINPLGRGAHV